MYCKYCGNEYENGAKFCPSCGARTDSEPTFDKKFDTYTYTPSPDADDEVKASKARKILTLGICSLAFACSFWFSIVGWIIAGIARANVREYEALYGPAGGMAKVGKHLSLGGLIGGIVMTFLAAFVIIIYMATFALALQQSYGMAL